MKHGAIYRAAQRGPVVVELGLGRVGVRQVKQQGTALLPLSDCPSEAAEIALLRRCALGQHQRGLAKLAAPSQRSLPLPESKTASRIQNRAELRPASTKCVLAPAVALPDSVKHDYGLMRMSDAPNGNVTILEYQGKTIHLIGTAHVSQRSVEEVQRVIREIRPDTVCVELDPTRYEAMLDEQRFRKLDIFQIIKEKKVLFMLASLVLTSYQRRLGEKLGVKPGSELLAGVKTAEEVGAKLVLADRDVQATLKRSWASLRFLDKVQLLGAMAGSLGSTHDVTEEQIEALKERDAINEMMGQLAEHMPRLQIPLIDERDRYLMSAIQESPGPIIVAVVGAGHVSGMVRYLGTEVDRDALSVIPEPSLLSRSIKWVIPSIILIAFYFGWSEHRGEGLREMIFAWIIPNALGAVVLSIVAGAKPLTVLVAGIASPITSLNPTIGAGMVAGLVEAWLRKPTVHDCEGVNEALLSLRGMFNNPFTRVLLVAVAATIGSAVGAWVGAAWVVKLI